MTPASLKEIRDFFEMNSTEFAEEWKVLSDADKSYFRYAVGEVIHGK